MEYTVAQPFLLQLDENTVQHHSEIGSTVELDEATAEPMLAAGVITAPGGVEPETESDNALTPRPQGGQGETTPNPHEQAAQTRAGRRGEGEKQD